MPEEGLDLREPTVELELVEWRRAISRLYADVRDEQSPAAAHALWRAGRDRLFRDHPQSPLPEGDRLRDAGLPYWPYDSGLRFELPLISIASPARISLATGNDGVTTLRSVGYVQLPPPLASRVDVWWLEQYGGGLFLPLRDGTAGETSYGGGRYLLDTAKGADLGSTGSNLIIDLNFLYHPSCRYNHVWQCPLPPQENTITVGIRAGEKL
jgi:uncharacterized protein (DUF1684 family)